MNHASSEVCSVVAVELDEALQGIFEPGKAKPFAFAKQQAASRSPLSRDGIERVVQPALRVAVPVLHLLLVLVMSLLDFAIGFAFGLSLRVAATEFLGDFASDGGEVALAVSDVVAMDLAAEAPFAFLQDREAKAAQVSDEGLRRAGQVVGAVNPGQQQAHRAGVGTRAVALLGCRTCQSLFVEPTALLIGAVGCA
ncbi:MAG: hypothetical protein OEZ06_32790, partial [Myxococcales bacterium]|nr:hypothetical protein [Myxococcales bacterium]